MAQRLPQHRASGSQHHPEFRPLSRTSQQPMPHATLHPSAMHGYIPRAAPQTYPAHHSAPPNRDAMSIVEYLSQEFNIMGSHVQATSASLVHVHNGLSQLNTAFQQASTATNVQISQLKETLGVLVAEQRENQRVNRSLLMALAEAGSQQYKTSRQRADRLESKQNEALQELKTLGEINERVQDLEIFNGETSDNTIRHDMATSPMRMQPLYARHDASTSPVKASLLFQRPFVNEDSSSMFSSSPSTISGTTLADSISLAGRVGCSTHDQAKQVNHVSIGTSSSKLPGSSMGSPSTTGHRSPEPEATRAIKQPSQGIKPGQDLSTPNHHRTPVPAAPTRQDPEFSGNHKVTRQSVCSSASLTYPETPSPSRTPSMIPEKQNTSTRHTAATPSLPGTSSATGSPDTSPKNSRVPGAVPHRLPTPSEPSFSVNQDERQNQMDMVATGDQFGDLDVYMNAQQEDGLQSTRHDVQELLLKRSDSHKALHDTPSPAMSGILGSSSLRIANSQVDRRPSPPAVHVPVVNNDSLRSEDRSPRSPSLPFTSQQYSDFTGNRGSTTFENATQAQWIEDLFSPRTKTLDDFDEPDYEQHPQQESQENEDMPDIKEEPGLEESTSLTGRQPAAADTAPFVVPSRVTSLRPHSTERPRLVLDRDVKGRDSDSDDDLPIVVRERPKPVKQIDPLEQARRNALFKPPSTGLPFGGIKRKRKTGDTPVLAESSKRRATVPTVQPPIKRQRTNRSVSGSQTSARASSNDKSKSTRQVLNKKTPSSKTSSKGKNRQKSVNPKLRQPTEDLSFRSSQEPPPPCVPDPDWPVQPDWPVSNLNSSSVHDSICCDICERWFHYFCVALNPSYPPEGYQCPCCEPDPLSVAAFLLEHPLDDAFKEKNCCHPDCPVSEDESSDFYKPEKILGMWKRSIGGGIEIKWLIKWADYKIRDASWESADLRNLKEEFEVSALAEGFDVERSDEILLQEAEDAWTPKCKWKKFED